MKIIGIQKKSFSFDDGRTITGLKLYVTEESSNVDGVLSFSEFISDQKLSGQKLSVGDEVAFFYNRYGKVQKVEVL